MARENRIVSPSIPVLTRTFQLEAGQFQVVAAVQAIHWLFDENEESGLDYLEALLPQMGRRTIERHVTALKKSGVLTAKRGYGEGSQYGLDVEPLGFKEMRESVKQTVEQIRLVRQSGVDKSAEVAETMRQSGGVIISTDSKKQTKSETKQQPFQKEADALEMVFKTAWEKRYSRSSYQPTKKDKKQYLDWAKAGIEPETLEAKAAQYMTVEKPYHLQNRHPVWLLEQSWNELAIEGLTPREECAHKWEDLEILGDYGPQVLAKCKCGHKGYFQKENP